MAGSSFEWQMWLRAGPVAGRVYPDGTAGGDYDRPDDRALLVECDLTDLARVLESRFHREDADPAARLTDEEQAALVQLTTVLEWLPGGFEDALPEVPVPALTELERTALRRACVEAWMEAAADHAERQAGA